MDIIESYLNGFPLRIIVPSYFTEIPDLEIFILSGQPIPRNDAN